MRDSILVCLDGNDGLAEEIINIISNDILRVNEGKVVHKHKIILDKVNSQKFSDNEINVDFENSVRGKRVYILTSPNTSDEIIKLNLAIDAAKRSAAREIVPILPYFPYQRSDKRDQTRGSIGAKVIAEMIEQRGATGIITFDLHADQIQGYFNIPVTHLEGKNVFDRYIRNLYLQNSNTVLASPDAGGAKRVKRMKTKLETFYNIHMDYVMLDKTRTQANVVDDMIIIGDVKGKHVVILDDMADTCGTLCKAADTLIEAGAKSVRAVVSHGVLSGNALKKLNESKIESLIISDSLQHTKEEKIFVISIARQIALAIAAINNESSYEELNKEIF